ncbi:MAG: DUF6370 family protein [Bacteroidota bacterium]
MKKIIPILLLAFGLNATAQETRSGAELSGAKKTEIKDQMVEASCGQCNFGMTSKKGCDLAVKIDGHSYFVEGTSIDKHGDAHAKDGFCNVVKKAKVTGEIKEDKFVATNFVLVDEK